MIVIYNRFIPVLPYKAINLCGIIFCRRECGKMTKRDYRHEYIHTLQQREMFFVFFFMWYVMEWMVHLVRCRSRHEAYRRISMEREAYAHEMDPTYTQRRRPWAWRQWLHSTPAKL